MLAHRRFALFWLARVLSTVAYQMQAVAVGWQLYALTGSALDLGLVGLVQFVPTVALNLLVGQVADRFDRRAVAAVCQTIEAGVAATLALGTVAGWLDKAAILSLMAVAGSARAFELPTMATLVPALVPRDLIPRATAWFTSASQTAVMVGPALGGVLYLLGAARVYEACGALLFLAAAAVMLIGGAPTPRMREPVTLRSVFSGVHFILERRVLVGTLTLDLFAVLLGGATALLPIYARDILGTGPWGLGLLRSSPAVGALATSIVLAHHPPDRRAGRTLFAAVAAFGAATVVFGLSRHLVLSMAALAVLGAADLVSVVIRLSLVQLLTPDEMRGRVSAVHSSSPARRTSSASSSRA